METNWKTYWTARVEQVGGDLFKQVGRTLNGEPMSQEMFMVHANKIIDQLDLERSHVVLDLCCGNGLLTKELAKRGCQVVAVDFSSELIENIGETEEGKILGIVSDAMEIKFKRDTFHHIVIAAALQHFTFSQTIQLFKAMYLWLKPKGNLLITDITNSTKMWNFYDSPEREGSYFEQTAAGTSALGTWYAPLWLEKLARHSGFRMARSLDQSPDYWYSHYRFDLFCNK